MKRTLATFSFAGLVSLLGLIGTVAAQAPATVSVRLVDTLSSILGRLVKAGQVL